MKTRGGLSAPTEAEFCLAPCSARAARQKLKVLGSNQTRAAHPVPLMLRHPFKGYLGFNLRRHQAGQVTEPHVPSAAARNLKKKEEGSIPAHRDLINSLIRASSTPLGWLTLCRHKGELGLLGLGTRRVWDPLRGGFGIPSVPVKPRREVRRGRSQALLSAAQRHFGIFTPKYLPGFSTGSFWPRDPSTSLSSHHPGVHDAPGQLAPWHGGAHTAGGTLPRGCRRPQKGTFGAVSPGFTALTHTNTNKQRPTNLPASRRAPH